MKRGSAGSGVVKAAFHSIALAPSMTAHRSFLLLDTQPAVLHQVNQVLVRKELDSVIYIERFVVDKYSYYLNYKY